MTRAKRPKAVAKKPRAPKRAHARRKPKVAGETTDSGAALQRAGWERACKVALGFPGMEVSTSYGTPALKVKGKFMARLRSEAEGALAIRCDFVDRQMLLSAAPEVFFLTDHYRDYPMILVRLDQVRADALPDLIERAWRMIAPKALITAFDAAR